MATTHATADKATDGLLPTYRDLGVDAEGYHHAQDRSRGAVHRIDPATGTRERVTDLRLEPVPCAGNALNAYVAHVAEDVGWAERVPTDGDIFGAPHCPQHDRSLVTDASGALFCPGCQG